MADAALQEADARPIDDWSAEALDQYADEITENNALEPLDIRLDDKFVEESPFVNPKEQGGGVTELISLRIPHHSHQGFFSQRPSRPPQTPFHGDVDDHFVTLQYFASQDQREVKRRILAQTSVLTEWVDCYQQRHSRRQGTHANGRS